MVDAKLAGRAVPAEQPGGRGSGGPPADYFTVDVTEAVLISIGDPADHLLIETWKPGRGLRSVVRR